MSKEFGLDWKQYDNTRMMEFAQMMKFENERQEKENKKAYGGHKTGRNHRGQR